MGSLGSEEFYSAHLHSRRAKCISYLCPNVMYMIVACGYVYAVLICKHFAQTVQFCERQNVIECQCMKQDMSSALQNHSSQLEDFSC